MNDEEIARCQNAINLANAGQTQIAYNQFCALYPGNETDVTLLYWLAYTTPVWAEAQQSIETIARIQPDHPRLEELRLYVSRKQQRYAYEAGMIARMTPTLQCPYCHYVGPVRITRKISVGGWIWFAVFFLLCLAFWIEPVPAIQMASMGWFGFFFLLVGAIGFLFRKRSYTCSSCRIALGDIAS